MPGLSHVFKHSFKHQPCKLTERLTSIADSLEPSVKHAIEFCRKQHRRVLNPRTTRSEMRLVDKLAMLGIVKLYKC